MARWLAVFALAACSGKSDLPAAVVNGSGSAEGSDVSPTANRNAERSGPPRGWRREDLSRLASPLPVTVSVPPMATIASEPAIARDRDGFVISVPVAAIAWPDGKLLVSSGEDLDEPVTTAAQEIARAHATDAELVARRDLGDGGWVVTYRPVDHKTPCAVIGSSPGAKLVCRSAEVHTTCENIDSLVEVCASLEPTGALSPIPEAEGGASFRQVTDPKAVHTAVVVARAIVHDDRKAVLDAVGTHGIVVHGKKLSRAALAKLLAGDTVQGTFDINCRPRQGSIRPECEWHADDTGADGALQIQARVGPGVIPVLTFRRDEAGTWALEKVETVDQE